MSKTIVLKEIYIYIYMCVCIYIYIEEWCIELVLQLHLSCNICGRAHVFIWISVKMILMESFHGANCIIVAQGGFGSGVPMLFVIYRFGLSQNEGVPNI